MAADNNFLPRTPRQTLRRGLSWVPVMVGSVAHSLPTKGHKHGIQSQEQAGKRKCLSSVDSSCGAGGERGWRGAARQGRLLWPHFWSVNFSPQLQSWLVWGQKSKQEAMCHLRMYTGIFENRGTTYSTLNLAKSVVEPWRPLFLFNKSGSWKVGEDMCGKTGWFQ